MGIYLPNMEMPKNCGECFACKAELSHEKKIIYVCCFTRKEYGFDGNRMNDDCPLVPVPEHGRLIDADVLRAKFSEPNEKNGGWRNPNEALVHKTGIWVEIDSAPTIIPAELAEEEEG